MYTDGYLSNNINMLADENFEGKEIIAHVMFCCYIYKKIITQPEKWSYNLCIYWFTTRPVHNICVHFAFCTHTTWNM